MPQHRLAAAGVELRDAVRLDVLLAGQAELLLDGDLDGQAVAVPAGLAGDVVALHGLEAGEEVLEDAGLDVVHAGHAVGGRRALVEDPGAAAARSAPATARRPCRPASGAAPRARGRADRPAREGSGTSRRDLWTSADSRASVRLPASRTTVDAEGRGAPGPAVPPSLARPPGAARFLGSAAGSTGPVGPFFRRLTG